MVKDGRSSDLKVLLTRIFTQLGRFHSNRILIVFGSMRVSEGYLSQTLRLVLLLRVTNGEMRIAGLVYLSSALLLRVELAVDLLEGGLLFVLAVGRLME